VIVRQLDSYYWNGVRAWLIAAYDERRKLMARYASLVRQSHPNTFGQGRLIELNQEWISRLEDEFDKRSVPPDEAKETT